MRNFRQKLPPLDPLVAFEAAARHLSFTQAAHELHLTQAAVSQQIRSLEEFLGVQLFKREHRSVSLTQQGRDYQHTVAATLIQLTNATLEIKVVDRDNTLTIAADQSIASLWLMPKLNEFRLRHPEIKLRLIASDDIEDCLKKSVSVAMIFGNGHWKGYDCHRIFSENVYPICSPEYIEQHGPIESVQDLVHHNLIELEDENWDWMNWRRWLNAQGVDLPIERLCMSLNSYPLVIDAAKNGQGVALGWKHLANTKPISDHKPTESRQLINPIGLNVETEHGYYMLWHKERPLSPEGQVFTRWIQEYLE